MRHFGGERDLPARARTNAALDARAGGFARRALSPLLGTLSCAWRLGMCLDRALTRRHRLPRPVVSVGNISLGGTGKTPFVIHLGRRFVCAGLRPAVLTRGYRSDGGRSDEPRVIAEALPGVRVLVGHDRCRAALTALAQPDPPEVFILDDGFQHWALARDVDLVLVDALRPFGTGKVFPAGVLREGVRALARADAVVVTRADLVTNEARALLCEYLRVRFPRMVVACAREAVSGYADIAGAACGVPGGPVLAVCGVGNPEAFFARVRREGVAVAATAALPDHHRWQAADVAGFEKRAAAAGVEAILTTAKDATKINPQWVGMPWVVMAIETCVIEGEAALWALIRTRVGAGKAL